MSTFDQRSRQGSLAKQKTGREPQSMARHDMFRSPDPYYQGNYYHGHDHHDGTPHAHADDPDYEYYEYDEDPSKNSFDLAEEEYI